MLLNVMPFNKFLFGCSLVLLGFINANAAQAPVESGNSTFGSAPDAELAIKQFKVPDGFKIDLFASEPQLMNPVCFCFDEQGRVFVAETFRLKSGVFDIRDHMNMYYDDLACRTVADRAAMLHKYLGPRTALMTLESESVRLLEDRTGTGHADYSAVFADGFDTMLDGIGAGLLARKGKVYYTDIPNLWLLQETNHEGKASSRTSLSFGYGVHFGYSGHDLHGLRMGPDGKLYFSTGDRGLNVTNTEGRVLDFPDMGGVLRCNPDGSDLEMYAYGLRNPQELAFDDHGNLFTGDNNCDHGDAARMVYVVEGGDTGWRIANQFSETTAAGVWNSEKLWGLQFPGQAAYILPPIAHMADGPAGLAHYPGTGFPAKYQDHFFLCDFRGAPVNSGVHSFAVKENGAGFEVVDHEKFFWNHVLATDCDFSPDGQLFVTDWVRGWTPPGLGRIYRCYDPGLLKSALVQETKKLIADGMENRPVSELQTLLGHADQRVRQEAQFELAARAVASPATDLGRKCLDALTQTAINSANQLARLHAIWGVGQIGRKSSESMKPILPLLADKDAEVRAQTAKVLGEGHFKGAFAGLTNLLADSDLRVRFFAAIALGKLGNPDAVKPLCVMLRENSDKDVFLRHAGVMGLLGSADKAALIEAGKSDWRSVRMAALLAMRRKQMPEVSMFLHDTDSLVVLEAARAISDLPIKQALPELAALIAHPTGIHMLDWRVVNANFREGEPTNATALATFAANNSYTNEIVRGEALVALAGWEKPFPRDRITGLWRPLPPRDRNVAVDALKPVIAELVGKAPDQVRLTAILAARELFLTNAGPEMFATIKDTNAPAKLRVEALKGLEMFHDARLAEAIRLAISDRDEMVRKEGNRLQASMKPENAVAIVSDLLEKGTVPEKQGALVMLSSIQGDAANKLVADWMAKLIAGTAPKEVQLELLQAAASHRVSDLVKEKLREYLASQKTNDEFAGFHETLYGGDAEAGRKIFVERPDASCIRCHKVNGVGGEVGPDLTGIGAKRNREYILESILYPNKQIAPGFESLLVEMKGGQSYAGVVKSQDDQTIRLLSLEDNAIVTLKKSDIKSQIKGQSPMPEGLGTVLSKSDLRNLVEYLATLK